MSLNQINGLKHQESIKSPLVSILCNTYNHEAFIRDAINGFLIQKTTFPVEILVHDDASTDGTDDIIREYEKKHPDIIFPIYQKENQYSKGNKPGRFNIARARGKYLAICEGDDYWTDPLKLQKQIDFLEKNPDYVMSYHDYSIANIRGEVIKKSGLRDNLKRDFSQEELKKGVHVQSMTICYRNLSIQLPPEFDDVVNRDTVLISLLGHYGKGKYIAEIAPGVYRYHSGGVWSMISENRKRRQRRHTFIQLSNYYRQNSDLVIARHYCNNVILNNRNYLKACIKNNNLKGFISGTIYYMFDLLFFKIIRK